jgi:uncharacterized protein (TIGR02145 family)
MRYYTFSLIVIFLMLTIGCKETLVPTSVPTVSTLAAEDSQTSATVGGLLDQGRNGSSNPITERGVYWSLTQNPIKTGTIKICGSGTGVYSMIISDLTPNTTYFVIAYATNSLGTSFGEEVSFTTHSGNSIRDIEGNDYDIVTIGDQVWMKDNLVLTKLIDGTELRRATTPGSIGLYLAYSEAEYFSAFISNSGRFYNYITVKSKKICPAGWHVPSDDEWIILATYLGGMEIAGGKLKSTSGWESPNTGATNESGFSAIPKTCDVVKPGGASEGASLPLIYLYESGQEAIWWSSICNSWWLEYNNSSLLYKSSSIPIGPYIQQQQIMRSVRCVKDK